MTPQSGPRIKVVPLGARATAAQTAAIAAACMEAEAAREDVEFDASETSRFGPIGVAMLASSFAMRREAGLETRWIPPMDDVAREFIREVGLETSAAAGASPHGTLELRQMHALDAVYTESVADILVRGVPGITEENSYPPFNCA